MFHSHLMMIIAKLPLTYIYNCKTSYDILKTLNDTFAPAAANQEKDVIARWKQLHRVPR
jgi:hypothetical protein